MKYHLPPQTLTKTQKYPYTCSFVSENPFAPLENVSAAFHVYNDDRSKTKDWIFDCGAIDTDTYIKTANRELITVVGLGTIDMSPTLCLSNCLHVPTLS